MKNPYKTFIKTLLSIFLLVALPYLVHAQNVWVKEPEGETQIGLDFRIPSFGDFAADPEGIAFANYFYGNIILSEKTTLQLDLPISHYSNGGGEANFGIGNPYVGVQFGGAQVPLKYDVGVRIPTVEGIEQAHRTGLVTENYTRGAFIDAVSVLANIHYRYNYGPGWGVRIGGGPEAFFGSGNELLLKTYGQLLYSFDATTIGTGINGRWFTTRTGGDFSDQSNFNFGLFGSHTFNRYSAGAYLEIPFDDRIRRSLDYQIGLNFSVDL